MVKRMSAVLTLAMLSAAGPAIAADGSRSVVVTSSNALDNQLLVFDPTGGLIQSVPTLGQGGAGGNAGGVAAKNGLVAVVNSGSQTVSVFARALSGFELRSLVATSSQPVSVAFGKDHLYVLGTTTVESHRVVGEEVEPAADGVVTLLAADGSAAQVGVAGDELIATEKSGTIERIRLSGGAVAGTPRPVDAPASITQTPFGFVTRGSTAYVTNAGSDLVAVVKNGTVTAVAATGTPGGAGQHSPCWAALVGPFLFTTNSPSHSVSRLVAGGRNIVLDSPVAARTNGAPIDVAGNGDLLAVVESDAGGVAHLTQFRVDSDGALTQTASTAIASPANGVAIIREQ